MKVLKPIIAVVLTGLMCFAAGACASDINTDNTTANFDFSKNGYRIVRPADFEQGVRLSASLLSAVKGEFGVSPDCVEDTENTDGAEIVIGNSNRESTASALELLSSKGGAYDSDYIICRSGSDVVIAGMSDEATAEAVGFFVSSRLYAEPFGEETCYVSLADASVYTTITVNGVNLTSSNFKIVTPLYNHSYIVALQIDKLSEAITAKTGYTLTEVKDSSVAALPSSLQSYSKAANFPSKEAYDAYTATFDALDRSVTRTSYTHEIIIGDCNRTGCNDITDPNSYEIRVSGYKIYLNGGSPYATAMAVSEFTRMVNSGSLALTDSSSFTGDYYDKISSYDKSEYYTLTWGDDFDEAEIDEGKWHISYDSENTYSVGLNNRANYRASKELKNNYVKDGKLYIDAVYTDAAYYGGMLITNETMLYKHGYVEISCMNPHGQGFWTALWASSAAGPNDYAYTEIDINECYGPSHYVLGNTFAWLTAYGKQYYLDNGFGTTARVHYHKRNDRFSDARGFSLDLHTFGYEWDEEKVSFICDGEVYKTMYYASQNYTTSATAEDAEFEKAACVDAFSMPIYLRLSMALGFASRGYVVDDSASEWTESNSFITDYVHVYQYDGSEMYIYGTDARQGDINGDGVTDMADSAVLQRYLASWNRYDFMNLELGAADLTGDGLVTAADLAVLNNYLAGNEGMWGEDSVNPDTGETDEDDWMDWVG